MIDSCKCNVLDGLTIPGCGEPKHVPLPNRHVECCDKVRVGRNVGYAMLDSGKIGWLCLNGCGCNKRRN